MRVQDVKRPSTRLRVSACRDVRANVSAAQVPLGHVQAEPILAGVDTAHTVQLVAVALQFRH